MKNAEIDIALITEDYKERFFRKVGKQGPLPDQTNLHYAGLDCCWQWTGSKKLNGYGNLMWGGKTRIAHRFSFVLHRGNFDPKAFVLHKCDNPSCVNPVHLFLGDSKANMQDRKKKGRGNHPTGERNGRHTMPERTARGDRSGRRLHPERYAHIIHYSVTHPEKLARGDRNGARTKPEKLARGDRNGMRLHPGSVQRGEKSVCAKITEKDVVEIRRRREAGEAYKSIGASYGIHLTAVFKIVKRESWSHVP